MNDMFQTKLLTAAVALGLGVASVPAGAVTFPDFTVDETVVSLNGDIFVADKINGAYSEVVTFSAPNNFDTVAYGTFGQYLANDGTTDITGIELNSSYGLYALFDGSGTFVNLGGGLTQFTFANADFNLYLDPNLDTTRSLPGTAPGAVTLANAGDDLLIATAGSLTSGTGVLVAGVGGFFDLVFDDFTLVGIGDQYFTSPDPFYFTVNVDGDFDTFEPVGTQLVTGDFSAVFQQQQVPEPGSLALLGIGLMGLGAMARRRKTA